jgi:hypothetical protein
LKRNEKGTEERGERGEREERGERGEEERGEEERGERGEEERGERGDKEREEIRRERREERRRGEREGRERRERGKERRVRVRAEEVILIKENGCTYATNGGFFNVDGHGCVGILSSLPSLLPSFSHPSDFSLFFLSLIYVRKRNHRQKSTQQRNERGT